MSPNGVWSFAGVEKLIEDQGQSWKDPKLSSDGGLLLFREQDEALGLTEMAAWELRDRNFQPRSSTPPSRSWAPSAASACWRRWRNEGGRPDRPAA